MRPAVRAGCGGPDEDRADEDEVLDDGLTLGAEQQRVAVMEHPVGCERERDECRIIAKLDVHDRTQAIVVARQNRLVEPGTQPS